MPTKADAITAAAFRRPTLGKAGAPRAVSTAVAAFLACLSTCPAMLQAEASLKLWVADSMTRVSRTETPKPNLSAALSAARGEWESFQVVVTGPPEKVKGVKVEASLLKGFGTETIPAATVLRAHYVRVTESTPLAPLPPGEYADALVPQEFPWQELSGDMVNQPFWVDVFVPFATPAGTYSGAVTVGATTLTIPLTVEVLPFDMPVVPRLRTSFTAGWRRVAEAHGFDLKKEPPSAELVDLLDQYYDLLARHRLSVDQVYTTFPDLRTGKLNEAKVEAGMRKHLLHRHVATIGLPMSPRWPFADPLGKDRTAAQAYVAQWMKLLAKIRGESRGYATIADLAEPKSAEAYADVRRWGEFFNELGHRSGLRVPFLVQEQPTPDDGWWGRLDGTVDIWAPSFSAVWQDLEAPEGQRDIARRLKAGDEVWAQAARVQSAKKSGAGEAGPPQMEKDRSPVWALDYPPMNHRVAGWLLPLHGITGLMCWDTIFASPGVDVWTEAGNLKTSDGTVHNGEGSFIYPANKKRHGAHAPVASIRLKWLREMAEDYDYLMLARDLGIENEARKLAEPFARGFGDWEPDHEKLTMARLKLGELIAAKVKAAPPKAAPETAAGSAETVAKGIPAKPNGAKAASERAAPPPEKKSTAPAKATPAKSAPAKAAAQQTTQQAKRYVPPMLREIPAAAPDSANELAQSQ